jgi:hypothetical protein
MRRDEKTWSDLCNGVTTHVPERIRFWMFGEPTQYDPRVVERQTLNRTSSAAKLTITPRLARTVSSASPDFCLAVSSCSAVTLHMLMPFIGSKDETIGLYVESLSDVARRLSWLGLHQGLGPVLTPCPPSAVSSVYP